MRTKFVPLLLLTVLPGVGKINRGADEVVSFDSACGKLSYQEFGAGKPIVLLAGGPGMNASYLIPVAQMLARDGRRVILFHQRGTGKSAPAVTCHDRLTVAGAVSDLEELRQHLQLSQLTLAGHSWGGMLAMAYAGVHPEKVSGLLLIDSGPTESAGFAQLNTVMVNRLSAEEKAALKAGKMTDEAKEKLVRRLEFADPTKDVLLDQSVPPGETLEYPEVSKATADLIKTWNVTNGMKKVHAPVHLVFGEADPGFFVAEQIQKLAPQAQVRTVKNAGHYSWFDQPSETATAIQEAVADLP